MAARFVYFTLPMSFLSIFACHKGPIKEVRNEFKQYYDEYRVEGSFVLYDPQKDHYSLYQPDQFTELFSPASTFKICNTLIGLETGVIPDEHFIIQWDSVVRNPIWDKDHDMEQAFKNSTVWYYQEIARRIGGARMKYWLDKLSYANADTSGGIDLFWLNGGLRISPKQQIDFLQRLQEGKLSVSPRSAEIVKKAMIAKDTLGYILRYKTGWGGHGSQDVGWCVGYLESNGQVYYFSNCIQIDTEQLDVLARAIDFDQSRTAIVDSILFALHLIKR